MVDDMLKIVIGREFPKPKKSKKSEVKRKPRINTFRPFENALLIGHN